MAVLQVSIVMVLMFCVCVAISGKGFFCRDPTTGKLHPVNSTWESSSFCGNYTCKLRKKIDTQTIYMPLRLLNVSTISSNDSNSTNNVSISIEVKPPEKANKILHKNNVQLKAEVNVSESTVQDENEDRYLSESEIKKISEALQSLKKSDLESIVDIYNFAQDIYENLDKADIQNNKLEETLKKAMNKKENRNTPLVDNIRKNSYWYEPLHPTISNEKLTDVESIASVTPTIAHSYPSPQTQENLKLGDLKNMLYYYPMSDFQRLSSYTHYLPEKQKRPKLPPPENKDKKSCCSKHKSNLKTGRNPPESIPPQNVDKTFPPYINKPGMGEFALSLPCLHGHSNDSPKPNGNYMIEIPAVPYVNSPPPYSSYMYVSQPNLLRIDALKFNGPTLSPSQPTTPGLLNTLLPKNIPYVIKSDSSLPEVSGWVKMLHQNSKSISNNENNEVKEKKKLIRPSFLLPYPFSNVNKFNESGSPANAYFETENWMDDDIYRIKNQASHLSQLMPIKGVVSVPSFSQVVPLIPENMQLPTRNPEDDENKVSNDWQTEPLPRAIIDEIRANIKKKKLLKPVPLKKRLNLEHVGKLLKLEEILRQKRSMKKNEFPKREEDMYETFLVKVICQSEFDTEPGFYRKGNETEPFPACCPQKISER